MQIHIKRKTFFTSLILQNFCTRQERLDWCDEGCVDGCSDNNWNERLIYLLPYFYLKLFRINYFFDRMRLRDKPSSLNI